MYMSFGFAMKSHFFPIPYTYPLTLGGTFRITKTFCNSQRSTCGTSAMNRTIFPSQ